MSPGLAPGTTTRLLMSARTAFMGGNFPLVTASAKWAMAPASGPDGTGAAPVAIVLHDGVDSGANA